MDRHLWEALIRLAGTGLEGKMRRRHWLLKESASGKTTDRLKGLILRFAFYVDPALLGIYRDTGDDQDQKIRNKIWIVYVLPPAPRKEKAQGRLGKDRKIGIIRIIELKWILDQGNTYNKEYPKDGFEYPSVRGGPGFPTCWCDGKIWHLEVVADSKLSFGITMHCPFVLRRTACHLIREWFYNERRNWTQAAPKVLLFFLAFRRHHLVGIEELQQFPTNSSDSFLECRWISLTQALPT